MNLFVVGENHRVATQVPVLGTHSKIFPRRGYQRAIEPFYLAIGLRMIRVREEVLHSQCYADVLKELDCELISVLRWKRYWGSVDEWPSGTKRLRDVQR